MNFDVSSEGPQYWFDICIFLVRVLIDKEKMYILSLSAMLTVAVDGVVGTRPPALTDESVTVNDSVDSVLESSRIETEICFVAPLVRPALNITTEPATLS